MGQSSVRRERGREGLVYCEGVSMVQGTFLGGGESFPGYYLRDCVVLSGNNYISMWTFPANPALKCTTVCVCPVVRATCM